MVLRRLTAVVGIGLWIWLAQPPPKPLRTHEGPLLPRHEVLNLVSAGMRTLAADYYWLQTIQQVGRASNAAEYRDVYAYANLSTDLDPWFKSVYHFASVAIPFNKGRETWVNTGESSTLIRKGLERYPDDYQLQFLLSHNLMYYEAAGRILLRLSATPNAPRFLGHLATRVLAQAGDFDLAMDFATGMRDGATDPEARAFFERRILQLQSERVLQTIDAATARFQHREGRLPKGVGELVEANDLPVQPADPLGGSLFIDDGGRARTSAEWYRLELYDEAKKAETIKAQGPKLEFQKAP